MLPPGARLGPYEILAPLGSGGMGEVYRARDPRLDRLVAIKVLPAATLHDPEHRARFEREAKAIAALNHPNIVTIHSVEEEDGVPFLTMELVEGRTLGEIIPPRGVALDRFLQIATALADAISAAHQKGIVHRDLKPGNVMVTEESRVKVLDFGLAKLRERAAAAVNLSALPTRLATADGRILGTVAYMSPEQAEGRPIDHRSDIFSLGIVLYELATGERPFKGDNNIAILTSIIRDTPATVSDQRGDMPAEVSRLIRRCLEKEPARRVQDALDVRNELEDLRTELSAQAVRSATASAPSSLGVSVTTAARPRRRRLVSIGVALVVLLGAATTWLWVRGRPAPAPPGGPDRLAVTTFENRTGDRSIDALGQLTADALMQGLTEVGVAEVRPGPIAVRVSAESTGDGPVSWAAAGGATLVVTGAFYLQGDELRFQARVIDARENRLLHAMEPVSGPRGDPARVIDALKQRVMSFAAAYFGGGFDARLASRIPIYPAYSEFRAGVELFGDNYPEAIRHFQRATELDAEFIWPWFMMAISYNNVGENEKAAQILDRLLASRDRYSEFERDMLDWFEALRQADHLRALESLQKAEKLDPNWLVLNYLTGQAYYALNRPRDAIETFAKRPLNERDLRFRYNTWRFNPLTSALHDLGEYDRELQVAREAERMQPDSLAYRGHEARALVALGRVDELSRFVDQTLGFRQAATGGGAFLTDVVALELRAHGRPADAERFAERAVSWFRARPPHVGARPALRYGLARALELAGRREEARDLLVGLVREAPDSIDYRGHLGTIAARLGDRATAMRLAGELRAIDRPYLFGRPTYWRACIAAVLGEKDAAVDRLRESFTEGRTYTIGAHKDVNLEPLRGYKPYDDLFKPKG